MACNSEDTIRPPSDVVPLFIFTKMTIETLKKGVSYVQKLSLKTPERVVLLSLLLNLNIFNTFF